MSIKDEVKAEQQRIFNERMEQRKVNGKTEVENNNDSPQRLGCGTLLLIGLVLVVIILIYDWNFGERDSYDPNDWNFDGKVDIDDAEKKLDWLIENE